MERDLLTERLASATEELETTQSTLLRERATYSQQTAEWGQMVDKIEDLTIREVGLCEPHSFDVTRGFKGVYGFNNHTG